jgi:hypothetical protein
MLAMVLLAVTRPTPQFPQPSGPYRIGTRVYSWKDESRPEPFTRDLADRRELAVQVWYPTTARGKPRPYLDSDDVVRALALHFHVPAFLLASIPHAPTHSVTDAPVADGRFPVLLNPSGFLGFRTANLFWIEELVSYGYVVVGMDQPGTSAAEVTAGGRVVPTIDKAKFDRLMPLALSQATNLAPTLNGVTLPGGIIPFLADDLTFVLDQIERLNGYDARLAGHLDTNAVGVFGVSLGGYIGPEACRRDARFRACLAVDAGKTADVARYGLTQPLMIISRDADVMRSERAKAGGWPEPEIAHTMDTQRALFDHNQADAYYVTMNGMYHVNWTDAPILSPLVRWIGLAGPIDPHKGFSITNAFTLAFFDRYLKNQSAPLLDATPQPDKDARLQKRYVRERTHAS